MTFRTRFAPSPTGPLHLGHAFSALTAFEMARRNDGAFLLRIEDIDTGRAKSEWEEAIFADLAWLGLQWEAPVLRQSQNLPAYRTALHHLWQMGVLYPCTCNRRDIQAAVQAPQENDGPRHGPDGLIYPGTCRPKAGDPVPAAFPGNTPLRLNLEAALPLLPQYLSFTETGSGPAAQHGEVRFPVASLRKGVGDVVVSRRDMGTSYHLSVVLDDASQMISHVVRGQDLFDATQIHVVLQHLLKLPQPIYHHHALIRDTEGKRLAKRDDARAIATFRAEGETPDDIRKRIGLPPA
ncbi:MAG: tRNA glutamyl-Q(34) synthetase GluQRS [Roseobacter sp.]